MVRAGGPKIAIMVLEVGEAAVVSWKTENCKIGRRGRKGRS